MRSGTGLIATVGKDKFQRNNIDFSQPASKKSPPYAGFFWLSRLADVPFFSAPARTLSVELPTLTGASQHSFLYCLVNPNPSLLIFPHRIPVSLNS